MADSAAPMPEEKTVYEAARRRLDSLGRWVLAVLTVGIAALA
jgi:hypothetical protein